MKKRKVTIYLSDDEYQTIRDFSELLGMSFTGAGSIAIKLGIQAINLASNPKMKKYFSKELEKLENEIDL